MDFAVRRSRSAQAAAVVVLAVGVAIGSASGAASPAASGTLQPSPLRFEVSLSPAAERGIADLGIERPINGRVFVIVTRDGDRQPREQTGHTGVPLWGVDVEGLEAGDPVVLVAATTASTASPAERAATMGSAGRLVTAVDGSAAEQSTARGDAVVPGTTAGYPLGDVSQLPAGDYLVQAFLNVYTTFRRADGHVVRMHLNAGEGQDIWRAPGNAYSLPRRLRLDPAAGGAVRLEITEVIPPIEALRPGEVLQQGNPRDSEHVKFVKIRSDVLSEFWGRDMYIGANVLLPAGYDEGADLRYPVIYLQGHFPGRSAPFGFVEPRAGGGRGRGGRGRGAGFTDFWLSEEAPRVVAVTFRDANPYYDTSYSVDSANVGPYGTALTEELIPHLEREFRITPEPWARVLAGGSTGGWEALAMQVFHPDRFGGAWGWCPDPVDFRYYQIVDIYEDDNAYVLDRGWVQVERPNSRRPDGNITSTVRMENLYEHAVGPNSRSGGQWAIWEAVFGPVGPRGYPAPIWDPVTGVIDREIAQYWKENFDLVQYLQRNWPALGPQLRGKIHVAVGDMDTYYLEEAVYLLEELLSSLTDPPADATFEYGRRKPHCWIGSSPFRPGEDLTNDEFVRVAADHLRDRAPAGADLSWYR